MKNNRLILKFQQRFTRVKDNVFTEEVNKVAFNANDDKRIQSTDPVETYLWNK